MKRQQLPSFPRTIRNTKRTREIHRADTQAVKAINSADLFNIFDQLRGFTHNAHENIAVSLLEILIQRNAAVCNPKTPISNERARQYTLTASRDQ